MPLSDEELLARSNAFAGVAPAEIRDFVAQGEARAAVAGDEFVREGDAPDALWFLLDGEVEVVRRNLAIARLSAVQTLGEFALFDPAPRSATLRAVGECRLLRVPLERLDGSPIAVRLRSNVAAEVVREFRDTSRAATGWLEQKLAEAEKRNALGQFMARIVSICALYMFVMSELTNRWAFGPGYSFFLVLVQFLLATSVAIFIRRSSLPPSTFGLSWSNWRKDCVEAVLWALPLLALLVAVKASLIHFVPRYAQVPLFDWGAPWRTSLGYFVLVEVVYFVFTPVQEFITRSGMQAPFELYLEGRHARLAAIVLSSVIFSSMHLHYGFVFAMAVLPMGAYWGWMFSRQRSLLGVTVSHLIVGNFVFAVMGVGGIIT